VKIKIYPGERGKGFQFEDKVVGGSIPKEYIPSARDGIKDAMVTWTVMFGEPDKIRGISASL